MGIYDRDYYRDEGTYRWNPAGLSGTTFLIILHVVLFFSLSATGKPQADMEPESVVVKYLGFSPEAIQRGEIWRIFTAHLIPSRDLFTIIIGMFLIYWAGRAVEPIYGRAMFLGFYFSAAVLASLVKLALFFTGIDPDPAKQLALAAKGLNAGLSNQIGIAAPLFALLVLFACHFPRQTVLLFFVLPVQVIWIVLTLVGLYTLSAALNWIKGGSMGDAPSVLAAAVFARIFYLRGAAIISQWQMPRLFAPKARPKLRVYDEEEDRDVPYSNSNSDQAQRATATVSKGVDEHLEAKLDQVLEKVARFGRESLTAEENEILLRASEAYKRRGR
jgi:membrane associated rhomboid family serine protease